MRPDYDGDKRYCGFDQTMIVGGRHPQCSLAPEGLRFL